jgi:cytochrome c oxidase subunit 2
MVWEDSTSHDDLMPTEIHLVVNKPVIFKLGSKDVIHGFFLPQFRLQMNCVPGIPTQFGMTPTITTDSMRQITGNPKFEYELACAQLCGASHWNMRRVVVVETQEEYNKWLATLSPVYDAATMGKPAKEDKPVTTSEVVEPAAGKKADK